MGTRKEIIYIHGGGSFSSYDAFLTHLQTTPLREPLEESPKRWRHTLRKALGTTYDVYLPLMPNSDNARYNEWCIWFERYLELVHEGVILMGHSLGGYFLAKYLSEHLMPVRARALYLLAAPYTSDDLGVEDCRDFAFDPSLLVKGSAQVEEIYVFHAQDDPVVPYTHALQYQALLPDAHLVSLKEKGHLLMEEFPELIDHVQKHV